MSHNETDTQHPVVIVGGGPVGLALALELALHGIRSVVLERRRRGESYPARTNLTNLRSMEHFRRWGIADQLRANDPVGDDYVRSLTWVTARNRHIVVDLERIFAFEHTVPFAADRAAWVPNAGIEKTLQDAAADHPHIEVRFGVEVVGFTQDEHGVGVSYTDDAAHEHELRGQYLVGADGSRSMIRHQLGIRMEGQPDLSQASSWYIHAPGLKECSKVGRSSFYFFINEHRDGAMLIAQDSDDRYCYGMSPPEDVDLDDWEVAKQSLYRNIGFELDVEPLSGGRVRVHSLLAPRFHDGRVFLVGDAAHLISPMGGFGMNLGIGDAADLGWKLAAVLNGWGGDRLLDSYGLERSPVIAWTQRECIVNTTMLAPQLYESGIDTDNPAGEQTRARVGHRIVEVKVREFASFGAQLGYHYADSAIIAYDGSEPPPLEMATYVPSASPGCRAPHVWLADDVSLYDRFGPGFTLLVLDGDTDTRALTSAADERALPLTILELRDPSVRQLYGAPLALIRPDQHVAWRGDHLPHDLGALLDTVRGA